MRKVTVKTFSLFAPQTIHHPLEILPQNKTIVALLYCGHSKKVRANMPDMINRQFSRLAKGRISMKTETYKIVRYYAERGRPSKTIKAGLSLEEAIRHCRKPSTQGDGWFDAFRAEGGVK